MKKSLAMHPDKLAQKGEVLTDADRARFQRLKEAYDTLMDPRLRELYDNFGERGMKWAEGTSSVDLEALFENFYKSSRQDRLCIILLLLALCCLILIVPVLACLKVDTVLKGPWLALASPVWLFDLLILFYLSSVVALVGCSRPQPPEGLDPSDPEWQEWKESTANSPLVQWMNLLSFCCLVVFEVFLCAGLDGVLDWSWGFICLPYFVWEGLSMVLLLPAAVAQVKPPKKKENQPMSSSAGGGAGQDGADDDSDGDFSDDEEDAHYAAAMAEAAAAGYDVETVRKERRKQRKAMKKARAEKKREQSEQARARILQASFRVLAVVFIVLQVDGDIDWNWWGVLWPVWLMLGLLLLRSLWQYHQGKQLEKGVDTKKMERQEPMTPEEQATLARVMHFHAEFSQGCCQFILLLTVACLLAARLETAEYSAFAILSPVYIIVGCCFCCMCCMACAAPEDVLEGAEDDRTPPVPGEGDLSGGGDIEAGRGDSVDQGKDRPSESEGFGVSSEYRPPDEAQVVKPGPTTPEPERKSAAPAEIDLDID